MKIGKLTVKITLVLAAIMLPIAWLLTTTSGLNTVLSVATMFSPIPFKYGQVNGKIFGQAIQIHDLEIEYQGKPLKVGLLTLDWQLRSLVAVKVQGADKFLPHAEKLAYQNMVLDQVFAHLDLKNQQRIITIQTIGQSLDAPLRGNLRLVRNGNLWDIKQLLLEIGKNSLTLQQYEKDHYKWNLLLKQPQVIFAKANGTLIGSGSMHNLRTTPKISANIHAKTFTLNGYQINNFKAVVDLLVQPSAPLIANITADSLISDQHTINDLKLKITGDLKQHNINFSAKYNKETLNMIAAAKLDDKIWKAHGKLLGFPTHAQITMQNPENLNFKLDMQSGAQNSLAANITLHKSKFSGGARIIADDIAFLMQWMPDVTRLKGKFNAKINVAGTLNKPDITTDAHLTEVTATIPRLGIKIKPLELHVRSDKSGKFLLHAKGKMRRGPGEFTVTGSIEPFNPNMPNAFNITGSNVEFINNGLAHLIASNNLNIHYAKEQQRLDITGNIEIHQGTLTIADRRAQTVKSKDVVFVNEAPIAAKKLITINPDLNLRIAEGVHFNGFGLNADVTGKLNISHRHDALYADGRVSIKEGFYQLPGQKLSINHGRLLYPPGTLLSNPVLDIKMLGKSPGPLKAKDINPDLELMVQGTAQKPMISETGLAVNKDRAISQAMLTGSGVISKNILQDKLKISEIGVTSRDELPIEFFDDPSKDKTSLKNKDVVVGRSLGRKFYVQYLHSIGEANQRVRLKYSLNQIWSIGLESGTQGGGADLSFAIER